MLVEFDPVLQVYVFAPLTVNVVLNEAHTKVLPVIVIGAGAGLKAKLIVFVSGAQEPIGFIVNV